MNVIAMLIGFIAIIALLDYLLTATGHLFHLPFNLTLNWIFGKLFYPFAWAMGIPKEDVANAATLLGQKLTINEFFAFSSLTSKAVPIITQKRFINCKHCHLRVCELQQCGHANWRHW